MWLNNYFNDKKIPQVSSIIRIDSFPYKLDFFKENGEYCLLKIQVAE